MVPIMHENGQQLRALCIPGIQDDPEDWDLLQEKLDDILIIERVERPIITSKNHMEWIEKMVAYESEMARECLCSLLLAHSFGTHRAGIILERNDYLKEAILLNPARNTPDENRYPKRLGAGRSDVPTDAMEATLWKYAFEMEQEPFLALSRRHAKSLESHPNFFKELKILKNSPTFQQRISESACKKRMTAIQAEGDPYYIGPIQNSERIQSIELGDEFGHYAHAHERGATLIAGYIRSRLEQLELLTEKMEGVYT